MSANNTDGLQALVRALGEAMYNEPGEKPLPMATTDAEDVIRAQLTENTGSHFLDSGSAYGRHHEENRENPPWERPAFDVGHGYVTQNVYHFMSETFGRNKACVAVEAALYAFGHSDEWEREGWLPTQEAFAQALMDGEFTETSLRALGVPDGFVGDVLQVQREAVEAQSGGIGRRSGPDEPFTCNTYNHEAGSLSQVLQGTNTGGPYAEYVLLQVHQGADVRGGYTGPRVYSVYDAWMPHERSFYCPRCDWTQAESCLYDLDELLFQSTLDAEELFEELRERTDEEIPDEDVQANADGAIEKARGHDVDGGVFHIADGCGGVVRF